MKAGVRPPSSSPAPAYYSALASEAETGRRVPSAFRPSVSSCWLGLSNRFNRLAGNGGRRSGQSRWWQKCNRRRAAAESGDPGGVS
jgi:hypothetical protein